MQRPYRNWIRVHDSFSFFQLAPSQCLVFVLFLQDIHNPFIGVCCPRPTVLIFGEQMQTTVFLWSDCTIVCSIWNGYRLHFQRYMDIILVSCWVGAVSKGLERRIVSCGPKHSVLQHSVPPGCPNQLRAHMFFISLWRCARSEITTETHMHVLLVINSIPLCKCSLWLVVFKKSMCHSSLAAA